MNESSFVRSGIFLYKENYLTFSCLSTVEGARHAVVFERVILPWRLIHESVLVSCSPIFMLLNFAPRDEVQA